MPCERLTRYEPVGGRTEPPTGRIDLNRVREAGDSPKLSAAFRPMPVAELTSSATREMVSFRSHASKPLSHVLAI